MRVEVDQELCIGCGTCVDLCPDVFDWNDDERAYSIVEEVPSEIEDQVNEAVESCPTSAILKS